MSEFILNRDFNLSKKGEIVFVPNHLDGEMVRNRIGLKVSEVKSKALEVAPKNKAVQSTPKKKRNVRR
jgi:hypothetical protein